MDITVYRIGGRAFLKLDGVSAEIDVEVEVRLEVFD